ncbi:MAG: hypothetical protein NC223_11365 [Butyrivibrio sp.]|nr:hypothetical protein [Butyrivibrio sp.]
MRKHTIFKRLAAGVLTGAMALAMLVSPALAAAEDKTEGEEKQEVDLNGTYHAALGIQTSTQLWIQRMAYFEETQNKMFGTDMNDKLFYTDNGTQEDKAVAGTFTDVEIAGNGTYTVSLAGADFQGETAVSQLHIATDIPVSDAIKFSDVELTVNGRVIVKFDDAVMEEEAPYIAAGMDILLLNHWRSELCTELEGKGVSKDATSGWNLLVGSGDDNISVTFTVSGFAYDKKTEETEAETDAPTVGGSETKAPESGGKDDSKGGLPTGAIIGIVAGAALVVIIIIAVAVSRKKKQ